MRGVFIKHISPDSPAAHNGTLRTGDRILEVCVYLCLIVCVCACVHMCACCTDRGGNTLIRDCGKQERVCLSILYESL